MTFFMFTFVWKNKTAKHLEHHIGKIVLIQPYRTSNYLILVGPEILTAKKPHISFIYLTGKLNTLIIDECDILIKLGFIKII